jgi:NhaA family Na+:H+ antiporter
MAHAPIEDGEDAHGQHPTLGAFPRRPVERLTRPLERFLQLQAAGGIFLLAATLTALVAANSELNPAWNTFWNLHLTLRAGDFALDYPLWYWINDGLMALFFFVIGLEIKRELVWGELRDHKNVILPAAGALGGVLVPVTIYLVLQGGSEGREGWAVPMATDIAFVVGCLALLGPRVPPALKVFLLSLAILDDILAVLVIALFFTGEIGSGWLIGALSGFIAVAVLNRIGVRRVSIYVFVGAAIWLCTLKSGIHPTVAGALLGLLTPASAWLGSATLLEVVERAMHRLRTGVDPAPDPERRAAAEDLAFAASESVSPLERLEYALHPWVSFAIMPIFALANAGVSVRSEGFTHPVAIAVALALLVGKPLGIVGVCWIFVRAGFAELPQGVSWRALLGAGQLGGIGFTMALFLASLSLQGSALEAAKSGILAGSALSMALGMALLGSTLGRRQPREPSRSDEPVPQPGR